MNLMESFISNSLSGGSGPSSTVLYTQQSLTPGQQAQARANIQGETAVEITSISGTEVLIAPESNHLYQCGVLQSLTVNAPPATGSYAIVFHSGTVASTTYLPATILGLEHFVPEPNTLYEINVLDNRAVCHHWTIEGGSNDA